MSELRVYPPPVDIVKHAAVSGMQAYEALCQEADTDYAGYWARLAREHVRWKTPFTKTLDDSKAPFFKWFEDGTLNASYNCLDRQVERGLGEKTAIVFEADDGQVSRVTYADLLARTCRLANALKARGVKKGDRVVIYMTIGFVGIWLFSILDKSPRAAKDRAGFLAQQVRSETGIGAEGASGH